MPRVNVKQFALGELRSNSDEKIKKRSKPSLATAPEQLKRRLPAAKESGRARLIDGPHSQGWVSDTGHNLVSARRDFRHNTRSALQGGRLDINIRKRSEVHVIQLKGNLRMGQAVDGFRAAMEEIGRSGGHYMLINFSEVPMIDSSGIGLLVRFLTSTKEKGGNIKLLKPSKFVMQTLKLVGVLNLFEQFDDEEKAVESFG